MKPKKYILPIIVFSQFCCTSLWFAGNGVMHDLILNFNLNNNALGHITSAVQFGFILGTLLFAIFNIADRFSPSKVFLICGILGAFFNIGIIWQGNNLTSILILRFLIGFFLSGIYPIGMKIASDYYNKGLGKSLGFLIGALVLGTAFPHLAKQVTVIFSWKYVIALTSLLAFLGGIIIFLLVPDGPFRKAGSTVHFTAFFNVFKNRKFRSSAFGYFGHMWELYAFWTFVPVILQTYTLKHPEIKLNNTLLAFCVIGIGAFACVLAGFLAQKFGTKQIARLSLLLSCACCIASPLFFLIESESIFIGFLFFWGMVVIADSPLFSTLVAQNASSELKGTALTIVNCIGFLITIFSIQLLNNVQDKISPIYIYTLLSIGPIFGLISLLESKKGKTPTKH